MKSKFEKAMETIEKETATPPVEGKGRGWYWKRESYNTHLSLTCRKSTKEALEQIRDEKGYKSVNLLANNILEAFIDEWERGKE